MLLWSPSAWSKQTNFFWRLWLLVLLAHVIALISYGVFSRSRPLVVHVSRHMLRNNRPVRVLPFVRRTGQLERMFKRSAITSRLPVSSEKKVQVKRLGHVVPEKASARRGTTKLVPAKSPKAHAQIQNKKSKKVRVTSDKLTVKKRSRSFDKKLTEKHGAQKNKKKLLEKKNARKRRDKDAKTARSFDNPSTSLRTGLRMSGEDIARATPAAQSADVSPATRPAKLEERSLGESHQTNEVGVVLPEAELVKQAVTGPELARPELAGPELTGPEQVDIDLSVPVDNDQSPIELGQEEFNALQTYQAVHDELSKNWHPPLNLRPKKSCSILVTLDEHGAVKQLQIEQASGILAYDIAARMAVSTSVFPEYIWGQQIRLHF